MELDLSDFLSAGFLITRSVPRDEDRSSGLLPPRLLSASGCICKFIPDAWCIEWTQETAERRIENAAHFGLDAAGLSAVTQWVTSRFGGAIAWPNIIMDIRTAAQIIEMFLSDVEEVKLIELALHTSHAEEFCRSAEPPPQQPGFAPNGRAGVLETILKARSPREGGRILGFEPLVIDSAARILGCSWLCNGLEKEAAEKLNIRPNQQGFIEAFADACRCVEYISRPDVGAEPGLWLPWLVIEASDGASETP